MTIEFTCGDALSGIAVCPDPVTVTENGQEQHAKGTTVDNAGNTNEVTVGPFKIDVEKPEITLNHGGVTDGGIYTLGAAPATTCTASDKVSGLLSCTGSATGGLPNGVGDFTYTAVAKDKAGNETRQSVNYKVKYRHDGVLQPINDTGYNRDSTVSVFRAGGTVPVKFQLKKADGTVVQANSPPAWLTPVRGAALTAPVDETVFSEPATNGTSYRWDSTSQAYIFNWGTDKNQANYYWRIGVRLDDGSTYTAVVGLR